MVKGKRNFLVGGFGIAFLLSMLCLNFFTPLKTKAAGVTIITHGYGGNVNGWITGMANQVTNYSGFPGTNSTTYTITLTTDGTSIFYQWSRISGSTPTNTGSGEIIIKLDWSQMAGLSAPYDISTYNVAAAASYVLLQTNSISDLGGHALVEFPIHMIGHSRGGSLITEISRILGTNGVWVDHLTTLDPHPFNNDGNFDLGFPTDASALNTYANVLFHDNYWQDTGILFDPDGEKVNGAYNRYLPSLPGGYNNTSSISPDHANIHLWYHGTVDERYPADDTEAQITTEFSSWYTPSENYGYNAGFRWSLLGRGDRTSYFQPEGPGYPAIRDGYNQVWDMGAGQNGNRILLTSISGNWPNVIRFNLISTNQIQQGSSVSLSLYYQWVQASTSNATVKLFLDDDLNPFNGNSHLVNQLLVPGTGTAGTSISFWNNSNPLIAGLNPTNAPVGYHVLYAQITGGGRTRYLYAPEIIQVLPAVIITTQPTNQTVLAGANVTFSVAASGVPTLKYQWQKNAANITGATNANYTTNNVTGSVAGTYSCVVSNAYGIATSSNAVLSVIVPDTTPPTLTIQAPTAGQQMTNALATAIGTAVDNVQVSNVWYQFNSGIWNMAGTTNSYTNWSSSLLTLVAGTNTLKAYALDLAGNISATNSVSFVSSNTFKLQMSFSQTQPLTASGLNLSLIISPGLNGHIQVSTNLTTWTSLTNFVGTNTTLNFRDTAATNSRQRFYRAVIP